MIGVDEVGRGSWAGPLLVVAARTDVSLPQQIVDSKLLNRTKRESLIRILLKKCSFGEGWISSVEIDKIGLSQSLSLGATRALMSLKAQENEPVILDGKFNYLPNIYTNVTAIVKADSSIRLVSAAGIYAKVRRDNFMRLVDKCYPNYGFGTHVGYGTKQHQISLMKLGPVNGIHRLSFKPLAIIK